MRELKTYLTETKDEKCYIVDLDKKETISCGDRDSIENEYYDKGYESWKKSGRRCIAVTASQLKQGTFWFKPNEIKVND